MRILKIIFITGTMSNGGAERVISVLSNKFNQKGHIVKIAQVYSSECNYELNENIELRYIGNDKMDKLSRPFQYIYKIRNYLKKEKPDVIISFLANINIYSIISTIGLGIPIIVSERNDPGKEPSKQHLKILRTFSYYFADKIIFQTKDARKYFNKTLQNKSEIIFNPLVQNIPYRSNKEKRKEVVTVARLSEQKNLELLIAAFEDFAKDFNGYVLKIYGEGERREILESFIRKTSVRNKVFLKGFKENVHEEIKYASMFVLSSDYEGMPNALLESMAMGIPSISTDCPVGGPREFINQYYNGVLVPIKNLKELTNAMKYIAEDDIRANEMGINGMEIKELVSVERIILEWEKAIHDVL